MSRDVGTRLFCITLSSFGSFSSQVLSFDARKRVFPVIAGAIGASMTWKKLVRTTKLALCLAIPMGLAGCSVQTINEKNAADLFDKFSTGALKLSTGLSVAGANIFYLDGMYHAANRKDWVELSRIVIAANAGDDVGYYCLGLAAQQLGYKDAARIYYQNSIDVLQRHRMPTLCSVGSQAASYLGEQCHGLVLPQAAYQRLDSFH